MTNGLGYNLSIDLYTLSQEQPLWSTIFLVTQPKSPDMFSALVIKIGPVKSPGILASANWFWKIAAR